MKLRPLSRSLQVRVAFQARIKPPGGALLSRGTFTAKESGAHAAAERAAAAREAGRFEATAPAAMRLGGMTGAFTRALLRLSILVVSMLELLDKHRAVVLQLLLPRLRLEQRQALGERGHLGVVMLQEVVGGHLGDQLSVAL